MTALAARWERSRPRRSLVARARQPAAWALCTLALTCAVPIRGANPPDSPKGARWNGFVERIASDPPRHLAAYYGYGNLEALWVTGRLLANAPTRGPEEDDDWWDNLRATYNRWESDEVPGAEVQLEYAGTKRTVVTDDEGYYSARFAVVADAEPVVSARYRSGETVLVAEHEVFLRSPGARFLLVSDVDDTVIHTGLSDLLEAAQLTFLENAKTRRPLPGVGALYRAFADPEGADNPVVYLSNSTWSLYDLLRDFLALNELPGGPLLLRDLGRGSEGSKHKMEVLQRLAERYDGLPLLLVGDSGQHDAGVYADFARAHSERVAAIYIRDVDPEESSGHDSAVDEVIERSRALGIPFLRVRDSVEIAKHAVGAGWLPPGSEEAIARAVADDREEASLREKGATRPGESSPSRQPAVGSMAPAEVGYVRRER